MAIKLSSATVGQLNPVVLTPSYDRKAVTAGMVHIGVGNFHRAHQCLFLEEALSHAGNESWGYVGLGLMAHDAKVQEALKEQDFLYTLWQKGVSDEKLRVIGCHTDFILAPSDPEGALRVLSAASTKIVTLTVTEKGYFADIITGQLDTKHPAVESDIKSLKANGSTAVALKTMPGYLVAAARRRIAERSPGFTVLSCDNVQENGCKARQATLGMAEAVDPAIKAWMEEKVTFPNSMVDRITPVTTDEMKADLKDKYNIEDAWPVVCEDFLLWVIEDKFPYGRPAWEKCTAGKCMFVQDVVPYEFMKLRLLNSVHQALAYPGMLLGHSLVHDTMADERMRGYLLGYMAAAGSTVPPVNGIDQAWWKKIVMERFSNPAIRDTIPRLTEDATNRIAVALCPMLEADAVKPGQGLDDPELLAVLLPMACWMQCLVGVPGKEGGAALNPKDERIGEEGLRPLAKAAWEGGTEEAATFLKTAFGEKVARPEVCNVLANLLKTLQKPGGLESALAHVKPESEGLECCGGRQKKECSVQ